MSQFLDKLTKPVSLQSVQALLVVLAEDTGPVTGLICGDVIFGIADGHVPATETARSFCVGLVEGSKSAVYNALRQTF